MLVSVLVCLGGGCVISFLGLLVWVRGCMGGRMGVTPGVVVGVLGLQTTRLLVGCCVAGVGSGQMYTQLMLHFLSLPISLLYPLPNSLK